ncbi:PREDICTED: uncharacterized protein LOC108557510 [Nicrophorus vespilloides]|uniref:Uncharacterized protein LOC108557510 n=1 Tax=Nicrophorus vespilloides TaxID=110193 RepID=A0ABM1M4M9_NICVS|nr:PREDICTED: uncharacterized protein LOC108557510 [Nicrophorus vespilloides]
MYLLLLLLIMTSSSRQLEIPNDPPDLDQNVHTLLSWYFKNASTITLVSSNTTLSELLLRTAFPQLKHSFRIFRDHRNLSIGNNHVSNNFLLAADRIMEIRDILARFRHYRYKATTNFLIISKTPLTQIFIESFKMKLKNLLILQIGSLKVFYHNYYTNKTSTFKITNVDGILRAFYDLDYNGYTIRGTLFETPPTTLRMDNGGFEGMDYMVFTTIALELNLTLELHEPYDGQLFGSRELDGTATGSINELYTGETDVSCNQLFLKNYNAPELLFTSIVQNDQLCVEVPKEGRKPGWTSLFATFCPTLWILLYATVISFYLCLLLMRRLDVTDHHRHRSWAIFDVLQVLFDTAPWHHFNNLLSEKIYLVSLLILTLLLNTSFQGSLVNVIRNPRYYKNINTLEELDNSGYLISTSSRNLRDTFSGSNHPHIQSLDRKLYLKPKGFSYQALLSRKTKVQYMYLIEKEKVTKHMVDECPQTYMLAYLVHRDSMFYQDMSKILDKLIEAGLPRKWYKDVIIKLTIKSMQISSKYSVDTNQPVVFTLYDLQSSFYILIIGLLCSGVAFAVEILRNNFK